MKITRYENWGDHHFGVAMVEGIRLDSFDVKRESGETVLYATATAVSQSTGEIYNLRYKLVDGEADTVCSCPACAKRQYFCKHQARLIEDVAEYESVMAQIEAERYAEFGMGYVTSGYYAEDASSAWYLANQRP